MQRRSIKGKAGIARCGTVFGLMLGLAVPAAASAPHPPDYVSGGIGIDEAMQMKRQAAHYAVELEFVRKMAGGHEAYLAGNPVSIRNAAGAIVLDTVSRGPYLLANLPAGRYEVTASNDGRVERRSLRVASGGHRHVVFVW